MGDYGHFTDSKEFSCEGNLFADLQSLSLTVDIAPRQHKLSSMYYAMPWHPMGFGHFESFKPLLLSLPNHDDFKSLLSTLSTRLTDRYLVTEVIQCPPDPRQPGSNITTPLYSVAKPFVWHRTSVKIHFAYSSYSFSGIDDESAGFASDEQSDDELRSEG